MSQQSPQEPKKRRGGTRRKRQQRNRREATARARRLAPRSPAEKALRPPPLPEEDRKPTRPVHPSGELRQLSSEILEEMGSGGVAKRPMHDVVRTSDDEVRHRERAQVQSASIEFRPDPELGDAAADLADELGRQMLGAATSGVDMSELVPPEESYEEEVGGPFIVSGLQAGDEEEEEFNLSDVDHKSRRSPGK